MRIWFKQLTQRWLVKRIPPSAKIRLNRHNIFIMPTGFGVCYGVCCLLLFILGTNYQNNLIILLSLLLISIFVTSMLLSFQNLAGLTVQRLSHQDPFAAQSMTVPCQLITDKPRFGIELQLGAQPSLITQCDGQTDINLSINALARGIHSLSRVTVSSVFPLGLYRTWSQLDLAIEVIVFPQPLTALSSLQTEQEAGEHNNAVVIGRGDNFHGLQQYQLGESLKRVAWKQVAQGRGMLTKQFSQGVAESQWLDFKHMALGDSEAKLSQLCYLVLELSKKNQPFGLITPTGKLEVSQGEPQRIAALNLLAAYRGRDE